MKHENLERRVNRLPCGAGQDGPEDIPGTIFFMFKAGICLQGAVLAYELVSLGVGAVVDYFSR